MTRKSLLQALRDRQKPKDAIIDTKVEAVLTNRRVVVKGQAVPLSGLGAPQVGDVIPVVFRGKKAILALQHRVRRAKAGWLRPTGGNVEELFVAVDPATGKLDIWFRNDLQTTALGLSALLPSNPAQIDLLERVRWGLRADTFLIWTKQAFSGPTRGHKIHTVFLDRNVARAGGAAPMSVDHVTTWEPALLPAGGIGLTTVAFDGTVVFGGAFIGGFTISDSTAVAVTAASLGLTFDPAARFTVTLVDVWLDEKAELVGRVAFQWAPPRTVPPYTVRTGDAATGEFFGSAAVGYPLSLTATGSEIVPHLNPLFIPFGWIDGGAAIVNLTSPARLWCSAPPAVTLVRRGVFTVTPTPGPDRLFFQSNGPYPAYALGGPFIPGTGDVKLDIGPAEEIVLTPPSPGDPGLPGVIQTPPVLDEVVAAEITSGLTELSGFAIDVGSLPGIPVPGTQQAKASEALTYPLTQPMHAYYFLGQTSTGGIMPDPLRLTDHFRQVVITALAGVLTPSFSVPLQINYVQDVRRTTPEKLGGALFNVYRQDNFADGVTLPFTRVVTQQPVAATTVKVAFAVSASEGPTVRVIAADPLVVLWRLDTESGPTPYSYRLTELATGRTVVLAIGLTSAQRDDFELREPWLLRTNIAYASQEPVSPATTPVPHLLTGWVPGTPAPTLASFLESVDSATDDDQRQIKDGLADLPVGVTRTPIFRLRLVDLQVVPGPEDR